MSGRCAIIYHAQGPFKTIFQDFHGSPVVKTWPCNARGVALIDPTCLGGQKQYNNKFNKDLTMVYSLKSLIKNNNNLPRSQGPMSNDTIGINVGMEPGSFSLTSHLKCHEVEKLSTTTLCKDGALWSSTSSLLHVSDDLLSISLMTFSEIAKDLMLSNWSWTRVLRVPWTARKSKQSILKEISPQYSLERLMLKL